MILSGELADLELAKKLVVKDLKINIPIIMPNEEPYSILPIDDIFLEGSYELPLSENV